MNKFITSTEFHPSHLMGNVTTTANKLQTVLGEPFYQHEKGDGSDNKTTIEWCVKNAETNAKLSVWDYKHWAYNNRTINKDEVYSFSVWYEDKNDFESLREELEKL